MGFSLFTAVIACTYSRLLKCLSCSEDCQQSDSVTVVPHTLLTDLLASCIRSSLYTCHLLFFHKLQFHPLSFAPQYFSVRTNGDITSILHKHLQWTLFPFSRLRLYCHLLCHSFGSYLLIIFLFCRFCCYCKKKNLNIFSMCKGCCSRELIFIITVIIKNIWCYGIMLTWATDNGNSWYTIW